MLDSLDTLIAFVLIMLVVSLLITIAVQMIASLLNLRGVNLAQGLKRTFAVIVPTSVDTQSETNAKKLANFILKGRFLSDSFLPPWLGWWRHAQAIRPEEVFDAIHRIAVGKEPVGDDSTLRESARKVLIALGVKEETINQAATEIGAIQQDSEQLTDAVVKSLPEAEKAKARETLAVVTARVAAARQAVATQIVSAALTFDTARKKFDDWTCISQERAQQWLTMHTRILTVIFAFLFAFGLQLDAVDIFKLVSSNKALREKLVAQATAVSSQAEKTLGNSPAVLQIAYDNWLSDPKDANAKSALTSPSPGPVKIGATDTRESVTGQIQNALAKIDNKSKDDALNSFNQAVDKTVTDDLEKKSRDYREVQANFKGTGFDLFPTNPHNPAFTRWGESWWGGCYAHILGIFFSVGFLSLGAPFWYHALKDFVSLRSQVAQNIAEQKDKPDAAAPSS